MSLPGGRPIASITHHSGCRIRDGHGREIARAIDPARLTGRLFRGLLGGAVDRYAFFTGNTAFGTFTSGTGGDPGEGETSAAGRWWKRLTAPERWTLRWSPSMGGDLDERLLLAAGLVLWFVDVRLSRGSPG